MHTQRESVFVVYLQIPQGVDEKEAVRIFVQFTRLESAVKGKLQTLYYAEILIKRLL